MGRPPEEAEVRSLADFEQFKELGTLEIPDEYLPEGASGSSWDPYILRLAAEAHSRHRFDHNMESKAWVIAWLLDSWLAQREALAAGGETETPERKRCGPNAFGMVVHEFESTADGARCECGEAEWKSLVDA